MKKIEGSISVFMALTITMMLSFCLVLIEGARERTMLLKADIVFSACVNSALAEYHQRLWEYYDVLYVDTSYRTGIPNYAFMQNRLQYYADENLKYDKGGWLSLDYTGSILTDICLATDEKGDSFYQKAIEAAKVQKGITMSEEVVKYLKVLETYTDLSKDLENTKNDITKQIEETNGTEIVWEGETVTVEVENPLNKVESGNFLLRKVIGESVPLSQKGINLSGVVSHRALGKGTRSQNLKEDEQAINAIFDKALYISYVANHFQNYSNLKEEKPLDYEVEYLIAGKASDVQNLEAVVARLLLIREADNYINLLGNEIKKAEAHTLAASVANVAVWLEPIVYQAILLYWAYEMSIDDLQLLFSGGEIPLCRSLSNVLSEKVSFCYEEYLYLLLLLEERTKLSMRSLDMVELFIRQEEKDFRIDGCVSLALWEGNFVDAYERQYTITKTMEYD